ncbi:unnamed protein product, partial [Laminaria digitata]
QLFDRWCTDDKNCVLIPGYSVEGTLAKKLLSSPDEVAGMDGRVRQRRCEIEYISFSAHVDFVQNKGFIDGVQPANVILVHGEEIGMGRLKTELEKKFSLVPKDERPLVFNPKNCAEVKIEFHREKVAKAVGSLARELGGGRRHAGASRRRQAYDVQGLLVNERFTKRLLDPSDLDEYTLLKVGGVRQRLSVPYFSSAEALRAFVREVFSDASLTQEEGDFGTRLVVHGLVAATLPPPTASTRTKLLLEWDASPVNDMIADSVVALATQAQASPAGISLTTSGHHHHHGGFNSGGGSGSGSKGREGGGAGAGRARVKDEEESTEETNAGLVKRKVGVGDGPEAGGDGPGAEGRGAGSSTREARTLTGASAAAAGAAAKIEEKRGGGGGQGGGAGGGGGGGGGEEGDPPAGSEHTIVRVVGFCLVRHAMQDTFGEDAVKANESEAEIVISIDGAHAKLRVVVVSSPPPPSTPVGGRGGGGGGGEAAWRCEVVECGRDSLRSQIVLLVERLRVAVSKS